ncbi:MAG: hypothetical protein NC040_04435, partial [Muribaculaceae bacterium]|nr:hypothetical protein [Muribaculaceae bacterium]
GGRALKFYASVRIEVRKGEVIKNNGEIVGASTRCKVVKNKVAPPFKEATFDMMYGQGISRVGEVLDIAVELDIIKKGGSWFSYNDQKLGQGRDNVKELLKNNPELMKEVEEKILARQEEIKNSVNNSENPEDVSDNIEEIIDDMEEDFEEFTPAEE